jgi:L-fucose mutarotase
MLKNISPIISPELLKILMEMGHGDEIVIGDGNFPAASIAQRLVRLDGHGVTEILDAILALFPLDTYVDAPVTLMQVVPGDNVDPVIWKDPPIWSAYKATVTANEGDKEFELVERFAFYERAKKAYAVVATGETAIYANIILKKGVVIQ